MVANNTFFLQEYSYLSTSALTRRYFFQMLSLLDNLDVSVSYLVNCFLITVEALFCFLRILKLFGLNFGFYGYIFSPKDYSNPLI